MQNLTLKIYSSEYQKQVKDFVVSIHEEFGFHYDFELDYDLENPQKFYGDAGGVLYLLLENERVVGTVAIHRINDEVAELKRFYIFKDYRHNGLGSGLLKKAFAFCADKSFKKCILDTTVKYVDALNIYKHEGFRIYKTEDTRVFMEKDL